MLKRLLILNITATVLMVISWILTVAAAAVEEWTSATGSTSTTTSTTLGSFTYSMRSGLYQTTITQCCRVDGASVPDLGANYICSTAAACNEALFSTATFCDHIDTLLSRAAVGVGSASCKQIQAGAVVTILTTLLIILSQFVIITLFLAKKIKVYVFAFGLIPSVVLALLTLILYGALAKVEIANWVQGRYASSQAATAPFTTSFGDSFSLMIASFVFQCLGLCAAILRWILRPKPLPQPVAAPPPKPRSIVYSEPIEVESEDDDILTPDRREVSPDAKPYGAPPSNVGAIRSITMQPLQHSTTNGGGQLPMCPNDFSCTFIDNFTHQLEYAHTCRTLNCTDSSVAHNRHWVHPHNVTRALAVQPAQNPPPPPRVMPHDAGLGGSASTRDFGGLRREGSQGSFRKTPSWLRPKDYATTNANVGSLGANPDASSPNLQRKPSAFTTSPSGTRF